MHETLDNEPTFDPGFPRTVELHKGQKLGEKQNYTLEEPLGAGGMGEVWLATEMLPGGKTRKVVCKTVRAVNRENQNAQNKILEQFMLIQKLNHQNICPIYHIEEDHACGHLIVMGYANGGSYADWFGKQLKQNGGLPVQKVCTVLRPIADALDYAHAHGVIHRDVKPENMMFTMDQNIGMSWLIDFGIASNLRTVTQATSGQFSSSGTASYMAPEQKTGQLQTAQTDEYSLALVALEFMAGTTFIQAIQTLPPAARTVMNKSLALTPSDRYATCREFVDALAGTTLPASSDPFAAFFAAEDAKEAARRAKLSELALNAFQSGKQAEAAEYLREYLKYHPENENAKRLLAMCKNAGTTGAKWCSVSSIRRDDVPVVPRMSSSAEPEKNASVSGSRLRSLPKLGGGVISGNGLSPKLSVSRSRLWPSLKAGDRKVLTASGIDYAFRWCPPDEFMMGSPKSEWDEARITWKSYDEQQHRVKLTRGFWLMETEVTQAMWESVMGENPSMFKGRPNKPVERVSWNDCQEFCRKLSQKLGQQVQLPTEAQWEYACRAGTSGAYAGSLDSMGWYGENSGSRNHSKTHGVGLKKPNAWGLYDMHGNVWEWCSDWKGDYSASPTSDPNGPDSGSDRVVRGGSWLSYAKICRSAARDWRDPGSRVSSLGFRALVVPAQEE